MLIWQWGLIGAAGTFSILVLCLVIWYFKLKKSPAQPSEADENPVSKHLSSLDIQAVSAEDKLRWLSLIEQQKNICFQLLSELPESDEQGENALICWSIFLDIEKVLIEDSVPHDKVADALAAFNEVLEKINKAQEVDALFKCLKVNQAVLKDLNRILQEASQKVFKEVDVTSALNAELDKLQAKLVKEEGLDKALAQLRTEIASMYELADRLKQHLIEVKAQDNSDEEYIESLEAFLEDTDESAFLNSMRTELDYKVEDLKGLAASQKAIIAELKAKIKSNKSAKGEGDNHLSLYDISMVRLEKSLLESGRVVKALEAKLESMNRVKYNLNIDSAKRDEIIDQKKAQLDKQKNGDDLRGVFEKEHQAMRSMEDLLHQGDLSEESEQFVTEQSTKLSSLRTMVQESELYVEMLERDLDKARDVREDLEQKLQGAADQANAGPVEATSEDMEEEENLREVNEELAMELQRLEKAQADNEMSSEAQELSEKVTELEGKIDSVQARYVAMEERYLNALMSKEDKP